MKNYISKSELKVGAKYLGTCRNSDEAVWNGKVFIYNREKFKVFYEESINHPEDDDGFDLFYPEKLLEVGVIKKENLKIGQKYQSTNKDDQCLWDGKFFVFSTTSYNGNTKEHRKIHPEDDKKYNQNYDIFIPFRYIFEDFDYYLNEVINEAI